MSRSPAAVLFLLLAVMAPLQAGDSPWVFAGSARNVWITHPSVVLQGSHGGLSGPPEFKWEQTVGPGPSEIVSPTNAQTEVRFKVPGIYEFRLSAKADGKEWADRATVSVYDATQELVPGENGKPGPKQDFGYSDEMLQKYFTMDYGYKINADGFDRGHVLPTPPPGVHPRILMNPEQLPDLQRRLKETTQGRIQMEFIRDRMRSLFSAEKGEYRDVYQKLVNGEWEFLKAKPPLDFVYNGKKEIQLSKLVSALSYMAFVAYVDQDEAAGKAAAAALATYGKYIIDRNEPNGPEIGLASYGYGYDFAAPFMTDAQKDQARQALAAIQNKTIPFGFWRLPIKADSNWVGNNSMYALVNSAAFEGEPGWDAAYYLKVKHTIEAFIASTFFPEGGSFEGFGKAFLKSEVYLILAKRERFLIATNRVRNLFERWGVQLLESDGNGCTWDEFLASHNSRFPYVDVSTMFWAYPQNPIYNYFERIDKQGRKEPKGPMTDFSRFGQINPDGSVQVAWPGMRLEFHYTNMDDLVRAVVVQDPDTSRPITTHMTQATQGQPLSALVNQRGLFSARTSWESDALRLIFQPRTAAGRGSNYDRGFFLISALGRIWIPYSGDMDRKDSERRASVIRVDGVGPSSLESRLTDYQDSPLLSFATGDMKRPYSHEETSDKAIGTPFEGSYNSFYLKPIPYPPLDMPLGDLPDWQTGLRRTTPKLWKDRMPLEKAFRTAALIRGKTPYVLIADDFKKDAAPHEFLWNLPITDDVTAEAAGDDVILTDPKTGHQLLLRLLASAPEAVWKVGTYSYNDQFNKDPAKPKVVPMVDLTVKAVEPAFRVLIVPLPKGTPPPVTAKAGDGFSLTMADGQKDVIHFPSRSDGSSMVEIKRLAKGKR